MYTILFVDDDEVLLGLNRIYLEKTGDFSVHTATTAHAALENLATTTYDAIITDYQMPDMDGITFLKTVRGRHATLPVIILTGRGREEVVIEAYESGADFYIQKGPDTQGMITELRHKILRAIEHRGMIAELDHSRQQMTDIINFLPDATFVLDIKGRVIAWNRAMEQLTGINRDAMLGKGEYEHSLPFYGTKRPMLADIILNKNTVASGYDHIEQNGDKISAEIVIPHFHNGRGAIMWATAGPLYDATGAITGAIESIRDISDLCAMKRDLCIAREANQAFSDLIPVGIFEMDKDNQLSFSNIAACAMFGVIRQDLGKPVSIFDFVAPEDHERVSADITAVIFGKASTGREYQLVRKDGSRFPGLVYAAPISDPDTQQTVGVRGVIVDLTERKRQAQDLLESRERLDLAVDAGDLGIWDIDMGRMEIHDIRRWAGRALGYPPEDLEKVTIATARSMVHPLDVPHLLSHFLLHQSGMEPLFESEFRLLAKNGSWQWVAVRGKIIGRDAADNPARIIGVINLITRPKRRSEAGSRI
ncbi:MAG: PAS domain S-box protein [Methanomicrobiales archaeon]|nr:PAS domain S-box protein [Methanomicrobiales archaeon]